MKLQKSEKLSRNMEMLYSVRETADISESLTLDQKFKRAPKKKSSLLAYNSITLKIKLILKSPNP